MLTPGDVKSANESSSPSGLPPPSGRSLSSKLSVTNARSETSGVNAIETVTATATTAGRRRRAADGGTTLTKAKTSVSVDAGGGRRRNAVAIGTTRTAANGDGTETGTTSGRNVAAAHRNGAGAAGARLVLARALSPSTPATFPPPPPLLSSRRTTDLKSALSRRPSCRSPAASSAKREYTAASFQLQGPKANNSGKNLLPGEAAAMRQYVESGQRIPRRGEIGLDQNKIMQYEASGFVMSGSRNARMNAVRVRKETQVVNAEDKIDLMKTKKEEADRKEGEIISQFREMVEERLREEERKRRDRA